jgi:uncharacterized protein YxjI
MAAIADARTVLSELESSDRFLIQQVFRPLANEYRISIPSPGQTEEGRPLLFVKQKRLKIKEDIRFRVSEDDGSPHLFRIQAKTVFEFRGRHDVLDGHDQVIGQLDKAFGKSLLRSHWEIKDSQGNVLFESHEANWVIAIVRRVAAVGPDWLDLLQWLPFNFVLKRDDEQIGTYKRVLGKLRDRYILELAPGSHGIDRQLVLAFAVALDALQDR